MKGLIAKLAQRMGIKWVLGILDAAANGRMGPAWRSAYWGLAGVKTWVSAVVGIAALALMALGATRELGWLVLAAGVGVTGGLLDKAWRQPHVPGALATSGIYRLLTQYSAEITTALVMALAWTQSGSCHELALAGLRLGCSAQATVLLVLACSAAYLGLLDASFAARAPLPPTARDVFRSIFPPPGGGATVGAMLVALALGATACASMGGAQAQLAIGVKGKGVDQGVVEGLVCRGAVAEAEVYAQDRGASRAEVTEVLERARKSTKGKAGCCAAEGSCGR